MANTKQIKQTKQDKEIEELKAIVAQLLKEKQETDAKFSKTPMRKYVKVINLFNGTLNISTEPFGKGKSYRFDKFGYDQKIPDNVLADIIANNETLFKQGYCHIEDPSFVREVGLAEDYKEILDFNQMKLATRSNNWDEVEPLFDKASQVQKENIVSILINDGVQSGEYDEAIVSRLERKTGTEILERIKDGIAIKEIIEEEQKSRR